MENSLFTQIKNAITDIQAADLQGIDRPLKQLAKLLHHRDLEAYNADLTAGIDLDAFLEKAEQSGGGMVGSHRLPWPDDPKEDLGLRLLLLQRIGSGDSNFAFQFSHRYFGGTSRKIIDGFRSMTRQLLIPFIRDYEAYIVSRGRVESKLVLPTSRRVFIVHGHDGEAREAVARFLSQIGFEPIILHEQASRGRTVIEKVEANSDVGFAVVLLTPDDLGRGKSEATLEPRARQNVLLELGYFIAKLGRSNVCALKRGEVNIPSDFAGVVWESMDAAGGWKARLGKELEAAGQEVDWNKVMRS
jgi:hypothetical protein